MQPGRSLAKDNVRGITEAWRRWVLLAKVFLYIQRSDGRAKWKKISGSSTFRTMFHVTPIFKLECVPFSHPLPSNCCPNYLCRGVFFPVASCFGVNLGGICKWEGYTFHLALWQMDSWIAIERDLSTLVANCSFSTITEGLYFCRNLGEQCRGLCIASTMHWPWLQCSAGFNGKL